MEQSTTSTADTQPLVEQSITTTLHVEHGPDDDLLEDHWDCFDAPSYFTALKSIQKSTDSARTSKGEETPPLKSGEVYGFLDFCCYRAPAWYRSEVNRLQLLAETQPNSTDQSSNSSLLDIWELSHAQHLPSSTNPTPPIIPLKPSPPAPKPPTRVQPSRTTKRKAPEPLKLPVPSKRRKPTPSPLPPVGQTYHIPKPLFTSALHLSLPASDPLHGHICHRVTRSFRNKLIARVTAKMMGIYTRQATQKPKVRRCVLTGYETAAPWVATGRRMVKGVDGKQETWEGDEEGVDGIGGGEEGGGRCTEADMLASPSCANWPPLPKPRIRMGKEDVEENVVEFEGLKFLVDVCGEPSVPRVMML